MFKHMARFGHCCCLNSSVFCGITFTMHQCVSMLTSDKRRPVTKLKAGLLIYRLIYDWFMIDLWLIMVDYDWLWLIYVSTLYSHELWVVTEWHSGYRQCASSKGCLGIPLQIGWGAQSFWSVSSSQRPQCRPTTHWESVKSWLGTWWPWWTNRSRSRRVRGLRLLPPKPGSGTEDRWTDF